MHENVKGSKKDNEDRWMVVKNENDYCKWNCRCHKINDYNFKFKLFIGIEIII